MAFRTLGIGADDIRANSSIAENRTGRAALDTGFEENSFEFARAVRTGLGSLDWQTQNLQELVETEKVSLWASTRSTSNVLRGRKSGAVYNCIVDPYEIRVLELKQGSGNDRIRTALHHCSVEFEAPSEVYRTNLQQKSRTRYALSVEDFRTPVWYTALSYTWGQPTLDAEIDCDGHVVKITRSLEAALKHFRFTDCSTFMWIDQVCINQNDTAEKGKQIPLMARIYSHALNTIIWLGESSAGSDAAFQVLECANYRLQFTDAEIDPADFEEWRLPAANSPLWEEVWKLVSRPWFSRLWIVQEVICSVDPWVACGETVMSWNAFSKAILHFNTCRISHWLRSMFSCEIGEANVNSDACKTVASLDYLRIASQIRDTRTLLFDLLLSTREAQCSDPRDKVYGLFGVCSEADSAEIQVRYTDEHREPELYRDVVSQYLTKGGFGWRLVNVLAAVDHSSPDLPSWVPDWRVPRQTSSFGDSTSSRSVYYACGRWKPNDGNAGWELNPATPNRLLVRGVLVDDIVEISDTFTDPYLTYINPREDNKTLVSAAHFVQSLREYPNGGNVFEAFWQTLVAGKNDTGMAKCPSRYAEIFSLLLDHSTGQAPSITGQTYSARQKRPGGKGRLELSNLNRRAPGQAFREIRTAMMAAIRNRRLGITAAGYLGLFPRQTRVGDTVRVLAVCHVPFLTRKKSCGNLELIGECFIHGIMNGEAVEQVACLDEFYLV